MKKNISFSFSSNSNLTINGKKIFSNSGGFDSKQQLTAQQEYWLNRLLREYGGKVFLLAILFMVLMIAVVFVAANAQ